MTKINTSGWEKFHLYDKHLFTIDSGTKLDKVKMTMSNPSIAFVGRANTNNGVTDTVDEIEGIKPYKAGLLTISLGGEYLGSCFIQNRPFYTSQNVNVLIPNHNMSNYCKMFIASVVFKESRTHYKAFIDELNRHMNTDFSILLPASSPGVPDWQYMENYMKNIEKTIKNSLTMLSSVKDLVREKIDTSKWGDFRIGDLFDIHPTKAYKISNNALLEEYGGINPVVVNTGFNNGVGGYTNRKCTEKAGIITFTDTAAKSTDSFFYQETDFVGYPHVQGMYTKGHVWNKYESLFLTSVIRTYLKGRYNFISKMTRIDIMNLYIKLPIICPDKPNWQYMEDYMRKIENNAKEKIDIIA